MPFSDPITGGQGALNIPAIKSPGFITSVTGWTINRDGSAEFNNLTIRGVFNGNNFILNASGFFLYSSTPALGNLIAVIAATAGVDAFGNAYSAGITSQENVFGTSTNIFGSGMQFKLPTATPVQVNVNANGLFVYASPGGALGNLALAATPSAGTDAFGNVYNAGIQINNNLLTVFSGPGGSKTSQTKYFDALIQFEQPVGTLVGSIGTLVTTPNQMSFHMADTGNGPADVMMKVSPGGGITYSPFQFGGGSGATPTIPTATDPTDVTGRNFEVWKDMRPLTGSFVGTVTNEWPPQFRLTSEGWVEVFGSVQLPASGSYNGITFFTMPVGYRAVKFTSFPVAQVSGAMSTDTTTSGSPRFYTDSSGVCQLFGISPSINGTMVRFSGRYPLRNGPIQT